MYGRFFWKRQPTARAHWTTSADTACGTTGYVVNKASLISGGPPVVTAFRQLLAPDTFVGPYTPQGVDNDDPAATEGYFAGVDGAVVDCL